MKKQNIQFIHKKGRKAHVLLDEFRKFEKPSGELLKFKSLEEFKELDHYNPTSPMQIANIAHIAMRVEPKVNEFDSQIAFFQYLEGVWTVAQESPVLRGQDPFYCGLIEDRHVIGHVEVDGQKEGYRTVFFSYRDSVSEIVAQKPLAVGPDRMKDIRLVELSDKRIGVYTRPQMPDFGGLGKIGYFEINRLESLEKELASYMEKRDQATILHGLCNDDEWVGTNAVTILPDGQHGVLAHIAHNEEVGGDLTEKEYYAMTFKHDPKTNQISNQKIIATAQDFPEVSPKNKQLNNVIFPGGMKIKDDGKIELFVGLKDAYVGRVEIANPWV